jgi:hypothetical protein
VKFLLFFEDDLISDTADKLCDAIVTADFPLTECLPLMTRDTWLTGAVNEICAIVSRRQSAHTDAEDVKRQLLLARGNLEVVRKRLDDVLREKVFLDQTIETLERNLFQLEELLDIPADRVVRTVLTNTHNSKRRVVYGGTARATKARARVTINDSEFLAAQHLVDLGAHMREDQDGAVV